MPLKTMFRQLLIAAEAYLAEGSAMPSRLSESPVSSAHWVVSSSCTASDLPVS